MGILARYERTLQMIQEQLNNICVYLCSSAVKNSFITNQRQNRERREQKQW